MGVCFEFIKMDPGQPDNLSMSRFEIDDQFLGHHKTKRALRSGAESLQMWLALRTYVAINNTGGVIPDEDVDDLDGAPRSPRKWLTALVSCGRPLENGERGPGLVDRIDGGWALHDYEDHGLSPEEIERRKALSRERQRRWRRARLSLSNDDSNAPSNESTNASCNALGDVPDPIRSDPIDTNVSTTGNAKPKKTRVAPVKSPMTPDWQPSQAMVDAIAQKTGLSADTILRQVPEFRLYWLPGGKGNPRGKLVCRACDWDSRFSNRIDQLIDWGKLASVAQVVQMPLRQTKAISEADATAKLNAGKQADRF